MKTNLKRLMRPTVGKRSWRLPKDCSHSEVCFGFGFVLVLFWFCFVCLIACVCVCVCVCVCSCMLGDNTPTGGTRKITPRKEKFKMCVEANCFETLFKDYSWDSEVCFVCFEEVWASE